MADQLIAQVHQLLAVESNPSRHEWHRLVRDLLARIGELEHRCSDTTNFQPIAATDAERIARQDQL